jgi:hypothetical protein
MITAFPGWSRACFIFQTSGHGSTEAERLIKLMRRLGGSVWGQSETISWKELSREYRYARVAVWCPRLRALWSFLSSSQATSSVESPKRFKPASNMAESGTLCRGVYLGWWDAL